LAPSGFLDLSERHLASSGPTEVSKSMDKKLISEELLMRAIEKGPISARCTKCGEVETVFEVDEPIDSIFLSNYLCANCDEGVVLESW